jgi:restriction endonuclease Mrr
MTIYIFSADSSSKKMTEARQFGLTKSLAVFGWGYHDKFDLNLTDDFYDGTHFGKTKFLKGIKKGDTIVYVHYNNSKKVEDNHYGDCTIMKVTGEYSFSKEILEKFEDFGHAIPVDPESVYSFYRNSPFIHPRLSKALKPRANYQRFVDNNADNILQESIKNFKEKNEVNYFDKDIDKGLKNIKDGFIEVAKAIQTNHPDKKLEDFVNKLFSAVYSKKYKEVEIEDNGSGWKTDYGADLIMTYKEEFDKIGLEREIVVVVQVKSYKWSINDDKAIEQCKTAIEKFNADYALIVTTANSSEKFEEKLEKYSSAYGGSKKDDKSLKIISLIDGPMLAKLYLEYMEELSSK